MCLLCVLAGSWQQIEEFQQCFFFNLEIKLFVCFSSSLQVMAKGIVSAAHANRDCSNHLIHVYTAMHYFIDAYIHF